MAKRLKLTKIETCVELEQALGLARGQVLSITSKGDGSVEMEFADSVNLPDAALEQKLAKALSLGVR